MKQDKKEKGKRTKTKQTKIKYIPRGINKLHHKIHTISNAHGRLQENERKSTQQTSTNTKKNQPLQSPPLNCPSKFSHVERSTGSCSARRATCRSVAAALASAISDLITQTVRRCPATVGITDQVPIINIDLVQPEMDYDANG